MTVMKYLFAIITLIAAAWSASAANLAAEADSAYNKEDYARAVELYNQLLAEQGRSAEVYYNLGNAWYRRGNTAQAILAYERALRVDPAHVDARANLDFVNSRLEDKPEDNNSVLIRIHHAVVTATSANAWAWIALTAFILACAAAALYIFTAKISLRKMGFFGGIILLIAFVYFLIVAINAANRIDDHSEAIITAQSTLLNSMPRQPKQTEKVVVLHQGTKVEIIDSVATPDDPVSPRWYNVRVNTSAEAWLRATDVERI